MAACGAGCRVTSTIDRLSDEEIQDIVITNLTPRKCLGFKTTFQASGMECTPPLADDESARLRFERLYLAGGTR